VARWWSTEITPVSKGRLPSRHKAVHAPMIVQEKPKLEMTPTIIALRTRFCRRIICRIGATSGQTFEFSNGTGFGGGMGSGTARFGSGKGAVSAPVRAAVLAAVYFRVGGGDQPSVIFKVDPNTRKKRAKPSTAEP